MARQNESGVVVVILLVVLVLLGGFIFEIARNLNRHPVEFTVNKTERVVNPDGQGAKYIVYTSNGVYENTDSFLNMKFNSADLYNELQPNKKYECTAIGFRNGFFSWFENLIDCNEVK